MTRRSPAARLPPRYSLGILKTSDLYDFDPLDKITLPTAPDAGAGRGGWRPLGLTMKRGRRRLLGRFGGENSGGQAYHVMNRAAGGEMVFGDAERKPPA
jgi:hypothetical protein